MKKWLLVAGVVAVVVLGIVVFALPALGQGPTTTPPPPPTQNPGNGQGWYGCFGNGSVGGNGYGYGVMGGYMGLGNQVTLKRVADTLGLTTDQLSADLQQGQTLTQIASNQKVSTDAVVSTILAPENDMVQIGVKYGYLTQAQAQSIMDQATQWVGQMMTGQIYAPKSDVTPPTPGGASGGPGYGYGPGGMMGGFYQSGPNGSYNGYGFGPGGMMGGFGGRGMMGGW